ncbi:MAG: putative DNA-binding domain-containing protein [Gammaproteobacteria bacterium]|nr:putative DNA-binding domain-containing protein [Gammaproteobacteria bacterium]
MSELARLQGDFQEYLLRGTRALEAAVAGSERVPVATRLGIYAGGYGSRLVDALEASYPALAQLLGEEDFAALGAAYVRAHDSRFFTIRHYGGELEAFLGVYPETADVALLAELARWEWTLCAVFDAADAVPLAAAALARVAPGDWAGLRFTFHPSVRRLALSWNAPQLWQALTDGAARPQLRVVAEPVEWLLWRQDLTSYFRSLAAPEAAALDAARAGATFGELCERLAAVHGAERAPAEAAALLSGWVAAGLLVAATPG